MVKMKEIRMFLSNNMKLIETYFSNIYKFYILETCNTLEEAKSKIKKDVIDELTYSKNTKQDIKNLNKIIKLIEV